MRRTFGNTARAGDARHGRDALEEVAGALLHARPLWRGSCGCINFCRGLHQPAAGSRVSLVSSEL